MHAETVHQSLTIYNNAAMKNNPTTPKNFFITACCFEGSLIVLAVFLGWLADINPLEFLQYTEHAFFGGLWATIPLFVIFLSMEYMSIAGVQKIRELLLKTISPYIHQYHWTDLLMLAVITGVCEEVLFRGLIQPWLENSWGVTNGLIASSILFGLVHAVTPLYALLATGVGLYLGLFLDYGGERNLLTPIVIHSAYDFLIFLRLGRLYHKDFCINKND